MTYQFKKRSRSHSNRWKRIRKTLATLLAKALQQEHTGLQSSQSGLGLQTPNGGRKYVNNAERRRFVTAAQKLPVSKRLFCLMLVWTGARVSEILAVTPASIDLDTGVVCIQTLKRRRRDIARQIPLPPNLLLSLESTFNIRTLQRVPDAANRRLWPWSRSSGWRYIKGVMKAADIVGGAAMPKGLRHGFAVAAFAVVPPHLVQRWLGHASLRTTAIYGDVVGPEEKAFAERLWHQ